MLEEQQAVMMQGSNMRTKGRKKEEWTKGGGNLEKTVRLQMLSARGGKMDISFTKYTICKYEISKLIYLKANKEHQRER